MSFDGFKRVSQDKKVTVLKHPKGHIIRVAHGQLSPEGKAHLDKIPGMYDGGDVEDQEDDGFPSPQELQPGLSPELSNVISDPMNVQGNPYESMTAEANAQREAEAPPAPEAKAPEIPEASKISSAFDEIGRGAKAEAKAVGDEGKAEADIFGNTKDRLQQEQDKNEQKLHDLDQERQSFMQDVVDGHIDPNRYIGSMSTGQRISTSIGLIAGGIGSALTGQENPAAKYLQSQIDNDIAAQKAELGKKENLLSANLKQFGNLHDAMTMTKANLVDLAALEMKQQMAKSQDPLVKARLQKELGELHFKQEQLLGPLKQRQQLIAQVSSGQGRPEQVIDLLPAHEQPKAAQEIAKAKAIQEKKEQALRDFDTVAKTATLAYKVGSPRRAFSGAEAAQMNGSIAELNKTLTGRFNLEENKKLMEQFAPTQRDTPEDVALKRKQLESYVSQGAQFPTLDRYGIDASKFTQKQKSPQEQAIIQRAQQRLQADPNDKAAALALKKYGM